MPRSVKQAKPKPCWLWVRREDKVPVQVHTRGDDYREHDMYKVRYIPAPAPPTKEAK